MRFNEARLNNSAPTSQDKKKPATKPQPGHYTSKDLEKSKDRPFLGGHR